MNLQKALAKQALREQAQEARRKAYNKHVESMKY